jgi:hypothetical protein
VSFRVSSWSIVSGFLMVSSYDLSNPNILFLPIPLRSFPLDSFSPVSSDRAYGYMYIHP